MRVAGFALVALALFLGGSSFAVAAIGRRAAGRVESVGAATAATSTRSAYSVVVSYTDPDGQVQRVERELQFTRIEGLPFISRRPNRLRAGDPVTVASRGNDVQLLHPHAGWAGTLTMLVGGVLLILMSFVVTRA